MSAICQQISIPGSYQRYLEAT